MLPALVAPQDLALLEKIQGYQPIDAQSASKPKSLIFEFRQTNYWSTMGIIAGLGMTLFGIWLAYQDIVSQSQDLAVTLTLTACFAAIMPFCYFLRMLGMWSLRRKFQRQAPDVALVAQS